MMVGQQVRSNAGVSGQHNEWSRRERDTLVCIKKTAMRHKWGECNRSDRNVKATQTVILRQKAKYRQQHLDEMD